MFRGACIGERPPQTQRDHDAHSGSLFDQMNRQHKLHHTICQTFMQEVGKSHCKTMIEAPSHLFMITDRTNWDKDNPVAKPTLLRLAISRWCFISILRSLSDTR